MKHFYLSFLLIVFPARNFLPTPKPNQFKTTIAVVAPIKAPKPLTPTNTEPLQELQPVPVAATPAPVIAAPIASSAGCVAGYSTGEYALDQIIAHESGGNSCATNSGGCFGLLQACPGAPLRAACGGDPACQIAWFQANKTGGRSWETIWALWQIQGYW